MTTSPELYTGVKGLIVPSRTFDDIQSTPSMPSDVPFIEGHLATFSVVSVNGSIGEDQQGVLNNRLVRISPIHGRSYEVNFGETRGIYWADRYENVYSSLSIKGGNLEHPHVLRNSLSPSGFLIRGLQDSDAMVRILKASDFLRSHNIETEMIARVMQPEQLPLDGRLLSLEDFKKSLILRIWEQNASDESGYATREEIPQVRLALEKMTFFITLRGHQISERLQDLIQPETKEVFQIMMANVFRYINWIEEMKARRDTKYSPQFFNAENDQDIERYLIEYLPARIARNYAKMHNLGLVHVFPHFGNVSAVGSIYDLDSVRGEPLGIDDEPITNSDIFSDLAILLYGYSDNPTEGLTHVLKTLQQKGFINEDKELENKVVYSFYRNYIAQRDWENDVVGNLRKIYSLFQGFNAAGGLDDDLLNYYSQKIAEQVRWDYAYPEDVSQFEGDYNQLLLESAAERFNDIKNDVDTLQKAKELEENSVSKIEYQRYGSPVFRLLEQDLRSKYSQELRTVTEVYGQEVADTVVVMYVSRYVDRVAKVLSSEKEDQERSYEYFYNAIKAEGWEEDIVPHLRKVYELFDGFALEGGERYLDYYLSLVCQQIDYEFSYDEDINPVMEDYIRYARGEVEATFRIEAGRTPSDTDIQALILSTATENGFGEDIEKFPWEQDSWHTFLNERLWPFTEDYEAHGDMLEEKYGEDVIGYVGFLLVAKAEKVLEKKFDPIVGQQAIAAQHSMELETIAKYLANPELALEEVKLHDK